LPIPAHSRLQQDIDRFSHFTSDYLALHPQKSDVIIDVRYSNLPHSHLPLWGIRFDASRSGQHAAYQLFRDASKATREEFMRMLLNLENAVES
jgi:inner membrane protein